MSRNIAEKLRSIASVHWEGMWWHKDYHEAADEIERLRRALLSVEGLVPTNWCDSLLTGSNGIKIPADCPEIERLLHGVRDRIRSLVREALRND